MGVRINEIKAKLKDLNGREMSARRTVEQKREEEERQRK